MTTIGISWGRVHHFSRMSFKLFWVWYRYFISTEQFLPRTGE